MRYVYSGSADSTRNEHRTFQVNYQHHKIRACSVLCQSAETDILQIWVNMSAKMQKRKLIQENTVPKKQTPFSLEMVDRFAQ